MSMAVNRGQVAKSPSCIESFAFIIKVGGVAYKYVQDEHIFACEKCALHEQCNNSCRQHDGLTAIRIGNYPPCMAFSGHWERYEEMKDGQ